MAEITWKNVEGPSPAAGLAALSDATETLNKGFTPLHQIIKDHEAQAAQHWDAQKDINTRDMLAKIQSTQDLGELNEARDNGRLNESAMVDRFGAQIDTAGMNSAIANQRDILRNKLQKELISEGLAAADASEDLAVGAKSIRDSILARGGHVDFAQTAAGQFMEGNKDRANLYAKAKNDRLLAAIAAVDMKGIKNHDDIDALVKKQTESGAKYDLTAYRGALENALRDRQAEEDRRDAKADRQEARQARKEDRLWRIQERAHTRALEQKAAEDAALAKRLAYNDKLYAEFAGQGADYLAKEKAALAGATGFAPERLKAMEAAAAKGEDLFKDLTIKAPKLAKEDLLATVKYLQDGVIPSGPHKGKKFNFSEKDAILIAATALDELQGTDDMNRFGWIRGESKADAAFRAHAIENVATRYRKFKNDSAALDRVAIKLGERDRAYQTWRAGILAGDTAAKKPELYSIESDPAVGEYLKTRLGNAGAGDENEDENGGNTGTNADAQTRANEALLAEKAAKAAAGAARSKTGLPAKDYLNSHPTIIVESVPRRKLPDGSWRKLSKEEMDKYVTASRTLRQVGDLEKRIKSLQKPLALYNPSPDNTSPEFVARAKQASEERRKRMLNTLTQELKELYKKPF